MIEPGQPMPDVGLEQPDHSPARLRDVADGWLVVQVLRYYG